MANLITLIRLLLALLVVALIEYASPTWQLLNIPLVIVTLLLDAIDGIVARARNETSVFGAVFDIAADRIIEITFWIAFIKSGLVSIWVPIIFLIRGILVDSVRKKAADEGKTPFSIMRTSWGRILVAKRMMRSVYGGLKIITFTWLAFLLPLPVLWPAFWMNNYFILHLVNNIFVYTMVALCLLRGLPVILEAIWLDKTTIFKPLCK